MHSPDCSRVRERRVNLGKHISLLRAAIVMIAGATAIAGSETLRTSSPDSPAEMAHVVHLSDVPLTMKDFAWRVAHPREGLTSTIGIHLDGGSYPESRKPVRVTEAQRLTAVCAPHSACVPTPDGEVDRQSPARTETYTDAGVTQRYPVTLAAFTGLPPM